MSSFSSSSSFKSEESNWSYSSPVLINALENKDFIELEEYVSSGQVRQSPIRRSGQTVLDVNNVHLLALERALFCYSLVVHRKEYIHYEDTIAKLGELVEREIVVIDTPRKFQVIEKFQHHDSAKQFLEKYLRKQRSSMTRTSDELVASIFSRNAMITYAALGMTVCFLSMDKLMELYDAQNSIKTEDGRPTFFYQMGWTYMKIAVGALLVSVPIIRSCCFSFNEKGKSGGGTV